ncbi:MAG: hypothetical protein ACR2PX_17110 [Endozoicomonas sp.]|uniref:hypothetical protein n=1 Tax=Endozoicomonas sp. TaxID=1892382 RepID=UPI003D9B7988
MSAQMIRHQVTSVLPLMTALLLSFPLLANDNVEEAFRELNRLRGTVNSHALKRDCRLENSVHFKNYCDQVLAESSEADTSISVFGVSSTCHSDALSAVQHLVSRSYGRSLLLPHWEWFIN